MKRMLLPNLRDRMSVRQQTALMAGLLCVITVGMVAGTAAYLARRQAVADAEVGLVALARTLADRLDQHMFERYREIKNVVSLAPLKNVWRGDIGEVRGVLSQIQATLPEYAWIGFASPEGVVQAATKGMLEGASVAQRPWFINGLKGPAVEDVHEAKLLDTLLRASPDEAPFRFVDVAVPVRDGAGALAGVLGAHLSWTWADEVRRNVLTNQGSELQPELLILAKDAQVLIGPPAAAGAGPSSLSQNSLAQARAADGTTFVDRSGAEPMLTAVVATRGLGDYPGLGWSVVARSPVATALARANHLFFAILGVGAVVALVGAFLANLLAGRTMRPLERLSRAVDLVGRDAGIATVGWQHGSRDVLQMSSSIRSLLRRLGTAQENERRAREEAATVESRAAEQLRLAEERSRRLGDDIDALQRLADIDPLTGLLNRRAFLPFGSDALRYFRRHGSFVSIIMIDIDHFKRVNDTYGHAIGDGALRLIGQIIDSEIRETDKAARFGGEEFVLLLREASEANCVAMADRIRERIAATPFIQDGHELHLTVSAGVASVAAGDRDIEDIIERADQALYLAKSHGRNRVAAGGDLSIARVA